MTPLLLWDGGEDRQLSVSTNRLTLDEDLRNCSNLLPYQLSQRSSINAGFNDIDILVVTMTLRLQLLSQLYRAFAVRAAVLSIDGNFHLNPLKSGWFCDAADHGHEAFLKISFTDGQPAFIRQLK